MRHFKKLISGLLAVIMLITLIPPYEAEANAAFMKVTNFNTAPSTVTNGVERPNWSHASASGNAPTNVTSRLVSVEVEYNSISSDNISNMYYEVKNMDTGTVREFTNNPPQVLSNQRVRFENVELTEGLNRITVVLNTPSRPRSVPAWVNFTDVTSIQELRINDQLFSNGIFVPETNQGGQNSVWISGTAPNSTEVRAYTTGNSEGFRSSLFNPTTGEFFFSAGDRNTNLILRPGDNSVEIVARNNARTYRTEREFVYNNGRAFLFNTRATGGPNITTGEVMLYTQPNFTGGAAAPYNLNITTDIKVNKTGSALAHNQIRFVLNGQELQDFYIELNNLAAGTVDVSVGGGTAVPRTVVERNDHYIIRNVALNGFPIDEGQSRQVLDVQFLINGNAGTDAHTQNFVYHYVNNNYPYIESVELAESGTPLFDGTEINLTNEEIEFTVNTRQNATGVRVYTNHQAGHVAEVMGTGTLTVSLGRDSLPEGRSTLRFVPLGAGGAGTTEYNVGSKSYLINFNPTPYVYAQNVFNGQVFSRLADLPANFELVPVNIPQNAWSNIRVKFNDSELTKNIGTGMITTPVSASSFIGGVNVLEIEFFNTGSAVPVATFRYELLYFEDNVPNVARLNIHPDLIEDGKFIRADGQDSRYHTNQKEFHFETSFANAEEVRVVVNDPHEDNEFFEVYRWEGNAFNRVDDQSNRAILDNATRNFTQTGDYLSGSISSLPIQMEGSGTYIVEITVTNRSGLFSTRMLEVVREPLSYQVHYPLINPTTNRGTVNGNYSRFYVEAEGADKIIYGRNLEVTETQTIRLQDGEREVFVFEATGLRRGNNTISFTVVRGSREDTANITLVNADTAVIGAEFKENISNGRIRAFDRGFDLRFPRGTILHKKDTREPDQSLSPNHNILVGIADPFDGRVNKYLHPLAGERSEFLTESGWDVAYNRLREPTDKFRPVSPMYWIDAGIANRNQPFQGGLDPYERGHEFFNRHDNEASDLYVPSQPGQLTLTYNPNIVQSAWRYVTVYHYGFNEDHRGDTRFEWNNIGGVVNQRNNTITVPVHEFGYYVVMYMDRSYDDIIGHPWARDFLDTLFSKGIMKPKESTRFVTNESISRGEFASLLVKAFEIPLDYEGTGTFVDVIRSNPSNNDGLYAYKYIETAARVGIVRGNLQGFFQPNSNITREDAAVMIARAANLKLETNVDRARQNLEKTFTDTHNFGDYTIPAVLAVNRAGYIEGKPNMMQPDQRRATYYFDPKMNLTRAEAAAIMMRVMHKARKIPSL
ncbi:S-layer homology domain-containing protein [Bacillus horti]|uniref:SLH domain-containing protein n=1 Tax=Caldalkalibacillus horti TaxID=77523 RepID=A0ABT9VZW5_9BACI|nr:S-layer homology domain-containing protein [Bacillus horti]MDQ0166367.1 hypothetical protein [Bacillus horti]